MSKLKKLGETDSPTFIMDCHQHFKMSAKTEGHTTNSKFQSSSSPDGISGLQGDFLLMLLLLDATDAADSLEQDPHTVAIIFFNAL